LDRVYFSDDDDIVDPCLDAAFKAIFTKDTPNSKGALRAMLSAILRRDIQVVALVENEPAVDGINDRQIRYDINCKLSNKELADIEVTIGAPSYEEFRLEYYGGKLLLAQDIKGKDRDYSDLKPIYQISFISRNNIVKDGHYLHHFEFYDKDLLIPLGGNMHIITIELEKLGLAEPMDLSKADPLYLWALFLRYSADRGKRNLVNSIIEHEEGIAMAAEALLTVSKDEIARAYIMSQEKYELDTQSRLTAATRVERAKWQSVVADKDATIAAKDAEIARLRAQSSKN
jgi:predicted transposase/invertase (TIGR01784 family)